MSTVVTPDEQAVQKALAAAITSEKSEGPQSINDLARGVFGDVSHNFVAGLIESVTLLKMAHLKEAGSQGADFLVFLAGVKLGQERFGG